MAVAEAPIAPTTQLGALRKQAEYRQFREAIFRLKDALPARDPLKVKLTHIFGRGKKGTRLDLFSLGDALQLVDDLIEAASGQGELVATVRSTRDKLITTLQGSLEDDESPEIASIIPQLPISPDLAEDLGMIARLNGEALRLADLEVHTPDEPATVTRALGESPIMHCSHGSPNGPRQFDTELSRRFLSEMSPSEAQGFRELIVKMREQPAGLIDKLSFGGSYSLKRLLQRATTERQASFVEEAIEAFQARAGALRSNTRIHSPDFHTSLVETDTPELFFDWFFHNRSGSAHPPVFYRFQDVVPLTELMTEVLGELECRENPFARRLLIGLERFKKGPIKKLLWEIRNMEAITFQRSSEDWLTELCPSVAVDKMSTKSVYEKITQQFPDEVKAFRQIIRDFEYLLQWARHYEAHPQECEVQLEAGVSIAIEGGQNETLVHMRDSVEQQNQATTQLIKDLERLEEANGNGEMSLQNGTAVVVREYEKSADQSACKAVEGIREILFGISSQIYPSAAAELKSTSLRSVLTLIIDHDSDRPLSKASRQELQLSDVIAMTMAAARNGRRRIIATANDVLNFLDRLPDQTQGQVEISPAERALAIIIEAHKESKLYQTYLAARRTQRVTHGLLRSDPRITPQLKAALPLKPAHTISIAKAIDRLRSTPSLPVPEVAAQDFEFGPEPCAIFLMAPNGSGKTRLKEMILQALIRAQKGVFTHAKKVSSPGIQNMAHSGIGIISTSGRGSSFQKRLENLILQLEHFERTGIGILCLEEFGRETDELDATALLIAAVEWAQKRGIYVVAPTHLASLYENRAVMDKLGIRYQFKTIDRENHRVLKDQDTPLKSAGIDEAERKGCEAEVIQMARAIQAGRDAEVISLPNVDLEPSTARERFSVLRTADLVELEMFASRICARTGEETFELGEANWKYIPHSPFRKIYTDLSKSGPEYDNLVWYLPPLISQAFYECYSKPLTAAERQERQQTVVQLQTAMIPDPEDPDDRDSDAPLVTELNDALESFAEIENWFCFETYEKDKKLINFNIGNITDARDIELHLGIILDVLGEVTGLSGPLLELQQKFEIYLELDVWNEVNKFFSDVGIPGSAEEINKQWVAFCQDETREKQFREVVSAIGELNFYVTLAKTQQAEGSKAIGTPEGEDLLIRGARNPILTNRAQALRRQKDGEWPSEIDDDRISEDDIPTVTPVDFSMLKKFMATVVTGTNGSGKSEGVKTCASALVEAMQTGFTTAEELGIPEGLNFVAYCESNSEKDPSKGTWANEASELQSIIDAHKAAGSPRGGVVFLDEPGKGTSTDEAVPFLLAYVKYFERRGVKVVFTTHMSSVYDYIAKLQKDEDAIEHQEYCVDGFAEGEKFKLLPGRRESDGIRVAQKSGLSFADRAVVTRTMLEEERRAA